MCARARIGLGPKRVRECVSVCVCHIHREELACNRAKGDRPKVVLSISNTSPVLPATWVLQNTKQVPKQVPIYIHVQNHGLGHGLGLGVWAYF